MTVVSTIIALASAVSVTAADITGFDFVTVGDPGNIAYDPFGIASSSLLINGRGSVDYTYEITRTEISTAEYLEFYNTFAPLSADLSRELNFAGGAVRDPSYFGPGERRVLQPGDPFAAQRSVGLGWFAALQFANWLENGKSSDPTSLRNGAYDIDAYDPTKPFSHNPGATYRLPNLDETLKAGFYDPNKNGEGPGWWQYGHSSDEPPVPGLPGEGQTPAQLPPDVVLDFFQTFQYPSTLLPVSAYPEAASPWGLLQVGIGFEEMTGQMERQHFSEIAFEREGFLPWVLRLDSGNGSFQPLDNVGFDGGRNPFGGFRIVRVVPAPGAASLLGAWGICLARRSRAQKTPAASRGGS